MLKSYALGVVAAISSVFAFPAEAVLITFDPLTSTVFEGDSFDVALRVSGLHDTSLDEVVSGFDLDVLFDGSILTATSFAFGSDLGLVDLDPVFGNAGASFGFGLVDLYQFSFSSDDELASSQGDAVLLGLLRLTAAAAGQSSLAFDSDPLFGRNIVGRDFASLDVDVGNGRVDVLVRPVSVPEPPTIALLGSGVLLLLLRSLQRRTATHRFELNT